MLSVLDTTFIYTNNFKCPGNMSMANKSFNSIHLMSFFITSAIQYFLRLCSCPCTGVIIMSAVCGSLCVPCSGYRFCSIFSTSKFLLYQFLLSCVRNRCNKIVTHTIYLVSKFLLPKSIRLYVIREVVTHIRTVQTFR